MNGYPTGETSPAGHVTGCVMGQDLLELGKAGRLDGVREGDRGPQLEHGKVVTEES